MCIRIYIFCLKKKQYTQTKSKKMRKTKETKEEKKKKSVVVNSIYEKSNGIQWYCLRICSV